MDEILVMVKPEAFEFREEIFKAFDRIGRRTETAEIDLPFSLFFSLYGHFESQPFYQLAVRDMVGKPVVMACYQGRVPDFAAEKTRVREKLAGRIEQIPNAVNYRRNGVHASDSRKSGKKEARAFGDYMRRGR